MVACKVVPEVDLITTASLSAPPHVGEYIWILDGEGNRVYYQVESVAHSANGGEVEIVAKKAKRPSFHKG